MTIDLTWRSVYDIRKGRYFVCTLYFTKRGFWLPTSKSVRSRSMSFLIKRLVLLPIYVILLQPVRSSLLPSLLAFQFRRSLSNLRLSDDDLHMKECFLFSICVSFSLAVPNLPTCRYAGIGARLQFSRAGYLRKCPSSRTLWLRETGYSS